MIEGRRLDPERRREQLLDVGAELFVELPYEDVLMGDVAERAGVSRGLVYRYFPAKRDLFAAVYRRAGDRLLAVSMVDAELPAAEQVLAGLDAHLDYFAANRNTVLAANRGALAGDPAVQEVISAELAVLRDRLVAAAGITGEQRALAAVAVHGWLAFVRDVCLEWLQDGEISRDQVRELCFRALAGLVDLAG